MSKTRAKGRRSYYRTALMRLIEEKVTNTNVTPEDFDAILNFHRWLSERTAGEIEEVIRNGK